MPYLKDDSNAHTSFLTKNTQDSQFKPAYLQNHLHKVYF